MTAAAIPFLDLVTPHKELEAELVDAFRSTLATAGFIGGPRVEEFESAFAQFCETSHCAGVGSGTDALRFALTAVGVVPGDIVVTVPHTFIATTEAISQAGALAEFVDVDEWTYNMDPAKLEEYLRKKCTRDADGVLRNRTNGKRVRAVVPVHLYGQMADMDAILKLADEYGLEVVEDACQAHGAEYHSAREKRWCKAGSMGKAAAFSFYPGKNLGACGEAGAVTTNDAQVARTVKVLRDHGQAQKYYHEIEGYNGRLDAMQAWFLSIKLKYLADWNLKRRERASTYHELFGEAKGIVLPVEAKYSRAVYHLYVIRVADREQLRVALTAAGIGVGIHYPVPLHLQDAYRNLGYKAGDFPVTERVAAQILSLPMFPGLLREQQELVVAHTLAEVKKGARVEIPLAARPVHA